MSDRELSDREEDDFDDEESAEEEVEEEDDDDVEDDEGEEEEEEGEEEEEVEEEEEEEEEEEIIVEPVKKRSRKGGKTKDPNKPKRNMSAYFLFSNAERPKIKVEHPNASFGDVAKHISKRFKEINEKERKKWDKRAAKDKIRYQEEMKTYVPPDESDDDDGGNKKKKKKAVKDPNKPKRNMSAFFLFSNAHRSEVKAKHPEASFGDIAKITSVDFKALSDKERHKWDKKAEKDKVRYQEQMKEYKP